MKKSILLILIPLLLNSCSSTRVKEDWAKSVTKIKGFLKVPPTIEEKKGFATKKDLKRCEEVQFTGVFKTTGMMNYKAEVTQGDKKFLVEKFGNKHVLTKNLWTGVSSDPQKEVIQVFKNYVSKTLPFKRGSLGKGKSKINKFEYLCNEKGYYTGMTKDQFLFVMGYPEKNNRTVSSSSIREQLVYQKPSGNEFEKNYFYFINGILKSWQD